MPIVSIKHEVGIPRSRLAQRTADARPRARLTARLARGVSSGSTLVDAAWLVMLTIGIAGAEPPPSAIKHHAVASGVIGPALAASRPIDSAPCRPHTLSASVSSGHGLDGPLPPRRHARPRGHRGRRPLRAVRLEPRDHSHRVHQPRPRRSPERTRLDPLRRAFACRSSTPSSIITPHVFHAAQATACLEAGVDVLLEKPMVMNAAEAEALIATRDRTGRLRGRRVHRQPLTAGPCRGKDGRQRRARARSSTSTPPSGRTGGLKRAGTWRQVPALSGGGFLFDTGAHMLNTVTDIAGAGDRRGRGLAGRRRQPGRHPGGRHRPARIRRARDDERLRSGHPRIGSDVRVFCERATLRTGIWGERLEIQRSGSSRLSPVRSVQSRTVWEQFLAVRSGQEPNPSPPEVGLRMARLWDAIRESSARGGAVVRPGDRGMTVRVTVWNEYRHERTDPPVRAIYPDGIHGAIADGLRGARWLRGPHGDARRAGSGPERRGPRRDRRADLVGPRRARRGRRTSWSTGSRLASSTGWA